MAGVPFLALEGDVSLPQSARLALGFISLLSSGYYGFFPQFWSFQYFVCFLNVFYLCAYACMCVCLKFHYLHPQESQLI
jgi:hypothetical protein